ncbi:tail fiber protein [Anaeromyxobacter terrae]|uniref:tail fiber protein n=1 Tax=Anaeromyxobacter terrae TaxID=2925406 RepID=UPI001F55B934|nr:tail fiber protein [Anaeromyxobacter sp. SG22]
MADPTNAYLSIEEVARSYNLPPEAVAALVSDGTLPSVRFGDEVRIRAALVDRHVRRGELASGLRRWPVRAALGAGAAALVLAGVVAIAANPAGPGERVPRQIPYRGYLEQNGAPVTDAAVPMTFELFTNDAGLDNGALAVWSETRSVSVMDGNFTVALGDDFPIRPELFAQPSLYLQVSVNGQPLAGRQRLLSVPYAQYAAATSAIPTGSIVAFGGPDDKVPAGWLPCRGQHLDAAQYPALFGAIGYTYGGSGNTFDLPDLGGRFLRGLRADNAGDLLGRDPGAFQDWTTGLPRNALKADAVNLNHSHRYNDWYFAEAWCPSYPPNGDRTGSHSSDTDNNRCEETRDTQPASINLFHEHTVSGGDGETRPANVAVNWIIKVVE